jgi:beta-lactam-binding protein with PASTA domain
VTATFTQNARPKPPKNCIVPNLVGERLFDALRSIHRRGCSVGNIKRITTSTRHVYYVIKQSPRHGSNLPAGSKVSVVAKTASK